MNMFKDVVADIRRTLVDPFGPQTTVWKPHGWAIGRASGL